LQEFLLYFLVSDVTISDNISERSLSCVLFHAYVRICL